MDSTDSEIKVQEARNVLGNPSPDVKERDVGETDSRGPGYIVSMRWGWVLVLQACHCTPPKTQMERR